MKIAYGKWNLLAKNTQKFGDAGFERVLADKGSNNADLMLSLRALGEVQERSQRGQSGAIYIAFRNDKGFAHLFNQISPFTGWRVVFVTSTKDYPRSLANLADEVLVIDNGTPETGPAAEVAAGAARKKTGPAAVTPRQREAQNMLRQGVESIVTVQVTVISFGNQLSQFLTNNNFPDPKPKALYVACGAPKSWTTLKVLEKFVPELVISEGEGNSAILRPAKTRRPVQGVDPSERVQPTNRVPLLQKAVREIVTKPTRVIVFNNHMRHFLTSAGYPDLKTRDFYVECGAPRSWTTLKVLEKFAHDLVEWDEGAKGNEAVMRPKKEMSSD